MRFYGVHTGRNNMAGLIVRSYNYYKPKNKDIAYNQEVEKQPNIIEDITNNETTSVFLHILSIIMIILNTIFLLMTPFHKPFEFKIIIWVSIGFLASFILYKTTKNLY